MAFNEDALKRAKNKSKESVLPGLLSGASMLLNCRNIWMNSHQTLTGLQLKRGGVTKQAVGRLHARGLCTSYSSILSCQVELGIGFDGPVIEWSNQMSVDKKTEAEMKSKAQNLTAEETSDMAEREDKLRQHRETQHPGFKIITDNVDLRISPRQMTMQRGNKDLHYCNAMAVKNKVWHSLFCSNCNEVGKQSQH